LNVLNEVAPVSHNESPIAVIGLFDFRIAEGSPIIGAIIRLGVQKQVISLGVGENGHHCDPKRQ
jgi:hypothetical protein